MWSSPRTITIGAGVLALLTSLLGLVLGLLMVGSVSQYLVLSIDLSESALLVAEESVSLIESVVAEVDQGLGNAADSITAASEGVEAASGRLGELADFLDGDLRASIEALRGTMPAAIQTAGVIDNTLRALSFLGVDYDPEEPFDVSLMAVEEALVGLPSQLSAQAEAIRALVPVSKRFAGDAAALAESFTALRVEMETSRQIVDSYRSTLDRARNVIERSGSSVTTITWMLRLIVLMMGVTGAALGLGMIVLGQRIPAGTGQGSGFDEARPG